ncbi:MAG: hypothetical protein QW303_07650, partial [Nitrososphaerota archaeon]
MALITPIIPGNRFTTYFEDGDFVRRVKNYPLYSSGTSNNYDGLKIPFNVPLGSGNVPITHTLPPSKVKSIIKSFFIDHLLFYFQWELEELAIVDEFHDLRIVDTSILFDFDFNDLNFDVWSLVIKDSDNPSASTFTTDKFLNNVIEDSQIRIGPDFVNVRRINKSNLGKILDIYHTFLFGSPPIKPVYPDLDTLFSQVYNFNGVYRGYVDQFELNKGLGDPTSTNEFLFTVSESTEGMFKSIPLFVEIGTDYITTNTLEITEIYYKRITSSPSNIFPEFFEYAIEDEDFLYFFIVHPVLNNLGLDIRDYDWIEFT